MDDGGSSGARAPSALGVESPTPHTGRADACVFRVAPSRCVARNGRSPSHLARRQPARVRRTRRQRNQLLYTLALDVASPARPLAHTDGASLPFWKPDSQSVGFFGQGNLKNRHINRQPKHSTTNPRQHLNQSKQPNTWQGQHSKPRDTHTRRQQQSQQPWEAGMKEPEP